MEFDPENPYPLAPPGTSYAQEKAHSARVDEWLGFSFANSEDFRAKEEIMSWQDKGPQVFLTPYSECRAILTELAFAEGETFVDFGAGYGRMGHVIETFCPRSNFLGFEIIESRVQEANRVAELQKKRFRLECIDICAENFQIPRADVYFLYDFGSEEQVLKFLEKFRSQKSSDPFRFVGRGGRVRHLIQKQHPWLWDVIPAKHFANFSIYSSGLSSANPL